jgi:ZIP family zinc transporter
VAVDGFIIGASAAGGETGTILALAGWLNCWLGAGFDATKGWCIVAISGIGGTVLICALIGNVLLTGASHALIGGTLAFSAAALLYLVTEELLMEAHTVEEKPVSTLVLFGGFLAFWSIQLMGQ